MAPEVLSEFILEIFGEYSRLSVAFVVGFAVAVALVMAMVKLFTDNEA